MANRQIFQSSYQSTIPEALWADAQALIDYVATYPFTLPECCKFCGSNNFAETPRHTKSPIPLFWCKACKHAFNQLTSSYFAGTQWLELWPKFTELHLAGNSHTQIHKSLKISASAISKRVDILQQIMKDRYPKLYKWWIPHHQFQDATFSPQVKRQANYFFRWLKKNLSAKQCSCPSCKKRCTAVSVNRPNYFYCKNCQKGFSLWHNSALHRLMQREKWLDFSGQLFKGASCFELARSLGISVSTANEWRDKFINQAKRMNLTELVYWLKWQRRRNYAKSFYAANKINKKQKNN